MAKWNASSFRPGVVELESREVPALLGPPQLVNGVVTVQCDDNANTILIAQNASGVQVQDVLDNASWSFALGSVRRVDVYGGAGDDTFTGRGNEGVRLRFYGGGGNNTFYGGFTRTVMVGGSGNNFLYGRSGNDYIDGGSGNDYIHVTSGSNILIGGSGDDTIIGGSGTDAITGSTGNNIIVAISSTTDKIDPGTGDNVLWIGTGDEIIGQDSSDFVHTVSSFANGPSLILNGPRIAEPTTLNGETYETFSNRPLFATGGPTINDVSQAYTMNGAGTEVPVLDDGWLLSALAAIVNNEPAVIADNMVDFGDGTYGVELNGYYFRVDDQLPVSPLPGNITPAYAQLGADNSMWVPILEKVFAEFQLGTNDYGTLNGPNGNTPPITPTTGTPAEVFQVYGYSPQTFALSQFTTATQFSNIIENAVNNGFPTVISVATTTAMGLTAGQNYAVISYNYTAQGTVSSLVLQNLAGNTLTPPATTLTVALANLMSPTTTGELEYGSF